MAWATLLVASATLLTPASEECAALAAAHSALLASSFSVERSFTLKVNGELKAREVTLLSYSDGELEQEILEKEILDKRFVLDAGKTESALKVSFACDRIDRLADGRYELSSANGKERVVFLRTAARDRGLEPVSWREDDSVRFLWKKLLFEAVADYRNFEWREATDLQTGSRDE